MPEAEEIIADEPVEEAAPEFILPEDFAQTVQGWDVPVDRLADAAELFKLSQSEEGQIDLFVRYGQNLGFGIKELEKLFADEPIAPPQQVAPAPVAAPVEPEDPDRLLSAAEVRQMLEAERESYDSKFNEFQQAQVAQEQRQIANRQNEIRGMVDAWFTEQGISDQKTKAMISTFGEQTLPVGADTMDPKVVMAGFQAGKAAYDEFVEAAAEDRLRKKAVVAGAQPTAVGEAGGSAGSEGDESAPNYAEMGRTGADPMAAAKARVRKRLLEG